MSEHLSADLSAYLDEELAPAERALVSAHLDGCRRCAGQLAELRATATLMAALPATRPSRSLVPSLAPKWNWLRPMRSLSAVTSGAFLMVFLVAAVAQSGSDLGGGPATPFSRNTGPAAAQPAAAPTTADARGVATAELKVATTGSPVPAAAPAAPDATAAPEAAEATRTDLGLDTAPPTPLIWLGLSLIAAIAAFAAHWRLRAA